MTLLYKLVWKPLTIDENAVTRISYKVMAVKARSRHDALVATAISYQRNFRRRSHTVLGEIWVHILCLSHKKLGNAFATCYCHARMMMQQMTGRGHLYLPCRNALSSPDMLEPWPTWPCHKHTRDARAMAKVGVVSNAKTMIDDTLPHQCQSRNRPPRQCIGTVAGARDFGSKDP